MELTELIGRRILVTVKYPSFVLGPDGVTEMKILEVSPSGQWVKMMSMVGTRFWRPTTGVALVEVLIDLTVSEPKPE